MVVLDLCRILGFVLDCPSWLKFEAFGVGVLPNLAASTIYISVKFFINF